MGKLVAANTELIHLLPRDAVLPSHQLHRDTLRHQVVQLHELERKWCSKRGDVRPHRHSTHRLHTTGDGDVAYAGLNEVGGEVNGLLARTALPVDRGRGSRDWKAGGEPCVARNVERLLANLAHAAEDHVLDQLRLDAGPIDDLFQHERTEDDGMHVLELSVAATDRCPHGLNDHGFAHVRYLLVAVVRIILRAPPNGSRDRVSTPQTFAWLSDFFIC